MRRLTGAPPQRAIRRAAPPLAAAEPDLIDLTVVIPAHNEQDRIGPTLAAICAYLSDRELAWEVIVVDDGSRDSTGLIVEAIAAAEPRIRLVRSPRNRGKGHAVRVGILESRGRDVLMSDADLSTPIGELDRLRAGRGSAVAAVGSRSDLSKITVRQHPLREALGGLGHRIITATAVRGIRDTQCGFKLFDGPAARHVFADARIDGWAFDVEILHLFQRYGWAVAEVPVSWAHATGSKLRPTAYLRVLLEIVQLRLAHRRTGRRPVPGRPVDA